MLTLPGEINMLEKVNSFFLVAFFVLLSLWLACLWHYRPREPGAGFFGFSTDRPFQAGRDDIEFHLLYSRSLIAIGVFSLLVSLATVTLRWDVTNRLPLFLAPPICLVLLCIFLFTIRRLYNV